MGIDMDSEAAWAVETLRADVANVPPGGVIGIVHREILVVTCRARGIGFHRVRGAVRVWRDGMLDVRRQA